MASFRSRVPVLLTGGTGTLGAPSRGRSPFSEHLLRDVDAVGMVLAARG